MYYKIRKTKIYIYLDLHFLILQGIIFEYDLIPQNNP